MSFQKRFLEWIGVKQTIDSAEHSAPLLNKGDIYWCKIGENVGVEISGKNDLFTRPVIVLTKFGRLGFFGIPVTTKKREGSWYLTFSHKGISETAILSQARFFSSKRLGKKMGRLDDEDYKKVKEAFCASLLMIPLLRKGREKISNRM